MGFEIVGGGGWVEEGWVDVEVFVGLVALLLERDALFEGGGFDGERGGKEREGG